MRVLIRDHSGHLSCCSANRVKSYDLLVDGYHTPLTSAHIAALFRSGRLRKNDPCKEVGKDQWRTLDELFPLLKYDSSRVSESKEAAPLACRDSSVSRPMTSAIKAGWICFAIGMFLSWFYPAAAFFFGLTIVTAIVAMCTHEINAGLKLLFSAIGGVAFSILMTLGTFVTFFAGIVALAKGSQEAHLKAAFKMPASSSHVASVSPQPSAPSIQKPVSSLYSAPANLIQIPQVNFTAQSRSSADKASPLLPANQIETDRVRQREAIRQAEQQRDRINAKGRRVEQLQKALESAEDQIRKIRAYGGDESFFVKQRDQLVRQKWDLQQ